MAGGVNPTTTTGPSGVQGAQAAQVGEGGASVAEARTEYRNATAHINQGLADAANVLEETMSGAAKRQGTLFKSRLLHRAFSGVVGVVERALHLAKGELKSRLVPNYPLMVTTERCLGHARNVQNRLQLLDQELGKPVSMERDSKIADLYSEIGHELRSLKSAAARGNAAGRAQGTLDVFNRLADVTLAQLAMQEEPNVMDSIGQPSLATTLTATEADLPAAQRVEPEIVTQPNLGSEPATSAAATPKPNSAMEMRMGHCDRALQQLQTELGELDPNLSPLAKDGADELFRHRFEYVGDLINKVEASANELNDESQRGGYLAGADQFKARLDELKATYSRKTGAPTEAAAVSHAGSSDDGLGALQARAKDCNQTISQLHMDVLDLKTQPSPADRKRAEAKLHRAISEMRYQINDMERESTAPTNEVQARSRAETIAKLRSRHDELHRTFFANSQAHEFAQSTHRDMQGSAPLSGAARQAVEGLATRLRDFESNTMPDFKEAAEGTMSATNDLDALRQLSQVIEGHSTSLGEIETQIKERQQQVSRRTQEQINSGALDADAMGTHPELTALNELLDAASTDKEIVDTWCASIKERYDYFNGEYDVDRLPELSMDRYGAATAQDVLTAIQPNVGGEGPGQPAAAPRQAAVGPRILAPDPQHSTPTQYHDVPTPGAVGGAEPRFYREHQSGTPALQHAINACIGGPVIGEGDLEQVVRDGVVKQYRERYDEENLAHRPGQAHRELQEFGGGDIPRSDWEDADRWAGRMADGLLNLSGGVSQTARAVDQAELGVNVLNSNTTRLGIPQAHLGTYADNVLPGYLENVQNTRDRLILGDGSHYVAFRKAASGDWHLLDSARSEQIRQTPLEYITERGPQSGVGDGRGGFQVITLGGDELNPNVGGPLEMPSGAHMTRV